MNDELRKKAEELAARHYFTVVNRERIEEGEYYYVAVNPDLPGCVADGQTAEEAKQELTKARVDFIYFLLEDDLPVPGPKNYAPKFTIKQIEEYKSPPGQDQSIPNSGYVVEDLVPA